MTTVAQVFDESNLESLEFRSDSSFEDCEFRRVDLTAHNLKAVSFLNCKFISCNMANQPLMNAAMRDVSFESCNLVGINWAGLKRFETPKFKDSKLNFSVFQGLKLKRIEMTGCSAVEVDFSTADLSFGSFAKSTFSGANFDRANLSDADFRTAHDYVFDVRTVKMKNAKFDVPEVLTLLTVLGAKIEF